MRFIHSIWIAMFFLVPCPLVMARQAQEIPLGLDSLKGRARLSALLDVTVQSDGPGPTKERLAQAKEASVLARDLGDPLAQARAMSQLGYWQYRDADYPGSLETYFQTRELCTKIQDRSGASLMEEQIGHTFLYCYADYNNALKYYLEAFETAKIANDSNRIVKTMSFIGDVYSQKGEFQTATSYFTKALAICENPGAPPRGNSIAQMDENAEYSLKMAQGILLVYMSNVHLQLENVAEALNYLERARPIFDMPGSNYLYGKSRINMQLGHIYHKQEQFDLALREYEIALEARRQLAKHSEVAGIQHRMGETQREAGRLEQAMASFREALRFRRDNRELLGIAETALGIGRVLMIQKKNDEALKYLDEAKSISEANAFNKERRGVYEALAKLWERTGDLKQALYFQQLYTNLQSQVQGASTTAAVLNLVKKYEKDRSVRDAQIVQASRLKMALLSLLLILPSGALLLIYLRRKRREASLLLAQKRDVAMADKQDQVDNLQSQLENSQADANKPKYQNSPMTDDLAEVYTRKLFAIMSKEQPYLDPDFTLDMLAQRMVLNPTYLSQLFNQYLNIRFLDFVNEFRIGESQRLLLDPQYSKTSVLDIGFQVGFSSKSTFYRAFKILTGMSPADFRVTSSSLPDSSRATLRSPLPLDSSTPGWKPYTKQSSPDRRES